MSPSHNPSLTPMAVAATICMCVLFGVNPAAIKISQVGIGKFTVAGLRFALAVVALTLWALATGRSFYVKREHRKPLVIISILFTAQLSFFYLGISKTFASRAALLANMVPFFVLGFAHFFIPEDRINRRKLIGMIIGFAGVIMVLLDRGAFSSQLHTGDLIILMAVFIWGGNAVFTKTVIHNYQAFQVIFYPMLFAIPVFFLEGWLWDGAMIARLDTPVVLALLYQGLISAAIGFVVWNTLLKRYGASTLHSFIFIMPLAGVASGALLLGEPVTHHVVAATLLVAVGIGIVNSKDRLTIPALPVDKG